MGASSKVLLRFQDRDVGTTKKCDGEIRLKSDLFQTTWDVTRAQTERPRHLCFWSGGKQAKQAEALDIDKLAEGCEGFEKPASRPPAPGCMK